MIFVCVDEGLQKTWDDGLSTSDIFAQSLKEGLVNCKSDHSNCSHQAQLTTSERLQVQKENALTERARWKRSARLETSTVL